MKYRDEIQFVNDMMFNEGDTFADSYGREWRYEKYKFYFSDLGCDGFTEGLECLHLYGTPIERV